MQRTSFRHIDLVRLPHPRVLVVMVSGAGLVTHKVIEMEEELTQDDLQACANYLNTHFTGMTLATIRARLLEMMGEDAALYDRLLKRVVSVGERAFAATGDGVSVYLDGASNMLEQAEFEDVRRMRSLLRTFEEKDRLVKILNACLSGGGVRVIIGHENHDPELKGMTLVTASCMVEGEASWGLGVMGSTRMEYARVMALVDQVARTLARTLQELRAGRAITERTRAIPRWRRRRPPSRPRGPRRVPVPPPPTSEGSPASTSSVFPPPPGRSWSRCAASETSSRSSCSAAGRSSRTSASAWSASVKTRERTPSPPC